MRDNPTTEFETIRGRKVRETDAALLWEYEKTLYWIPFSQIAKITTLSDGTQELRASVWILKQKGII